MSGLELACRSVVQPRAELRSRRRGPERTAASVSTAGDLLPAPASTPAWAAGSGACSRRAAATSWPRGQPAAGVARAGCTSAAAAVSGGSDSTETVCPATETACTARRSSPTTGRCWAARQTGSPVSRTALSVSSCRRVRVALAGAGLAPLDLGLQPLHQVGGVLQMVLGQPAADADPGGQADEDQHEQERPAAGPSAPSADLLQLGRSVRRQRLADRRHVHRPEQVTADQPVDPGGGASTPWPSRCGRPRRSAG